MEITRTSMITGKVHTLDIPRLDPVRLKIYEGGSRRSLQEIFWDLTADEREFIKTGITAEEWDKHLPPPEDA